MAETIFVDKNLSDEKIYESILPQIDSLLNPEEPLISNLSNVTAALKYAFEKISWVGFYFLKGNKLFLGPFQGKVACTIINIGEGVCGTAAEKRQTIIVEDVDKFPGHIACDSGSRSEIVVPLTAKGKVLGVLDLDSYQLSAFGLADRQFLERLCKMIVTKLVFNYQESIIKEQTITNAKTSMTKHFDLEERTYHFAKDVYLLCKKCKSQYISNEYVNQLVRASSSVGANYREANDSLGKKDFQFRIRISRKEAKESTYFLKLLKETEQNNYVTEFDKLIQESIELTKIFSAILEKSK